MPITELAKNPTGAFSVIKNSPAGGIETTSGSLRDALKYENSDSIVAVWTSCPQYRVTLFTDVLALRTQIIEVALAAPSAEIVMIDPFTWDGSRLAEGVPVVTSKEPSGILTEEESEAVIQKVVKGGITKRVQLMLSPRAA